MPTHDNTVGRTNFEHPSDKSPETSQEVGCEDVFASLVEALIQSGSVELRQIDTSIKNGRS